MQVASVRRISAEMSAYGAGHAKKGWPGGHRKERQGEPLDTFAATKTNGGFSVGVWESRAPSSATYTQDIDQLVFPIDGPSIFVGDSGREVAIAPGDGALLPRGTSFRLIQSAPGRCYFINRDLEGPAAGGSREPIEIRASRELTENSELPPAETYLSQLPAQNIWAAHERGETTIGMWDSTPFRRKIVPFPRYEFMYIQQGSFRLAHENGEVDEFGPGELFFVDRGEDIGFMTDAYLRKIFWLYQPALASR
jgi:uncharacterized cupin superfamily protein